MKPKETLGVIISVIAIVLILYELLYVNLTAGSIGVKGAITNDAILISLGFLLILIGPWLWLGEVPVAVKKLIEAKTGRKL
ncbi:MAG: hypothetical protein QXG17_03330 [Sulfolobales archaeon]